MPKALTIVGMVVAILTLLLFLLDLALGFPFRRANLLMDIGFTISALILGYLSWAAMKEVG